jgi:hypothetical protein
VRGLTRSPAVVPPGATRREESAVPLRVRRIVVVAGIALAFLERARTCTRDVWDCLGCVGREAVTGGFDLLAEAVLGAGLFAALILLSSFVRRSRPSAAIAPGELEERLSRLDPPLVLDVRTADEYAGELGHIEGALLIPVGDLEARLEEIASDRTRLLVPV